MPVETGKIAHIVGALKRLIFAQKSQFMFPTIDISKHFVWPCCNYNSMLFLQRLKEDFLPVKSRFEPNTKITLLSNQIVTNFCSFIPHLNGRETINVPEIFSGVHGFTEKAVKL